VFEPGDRVKRAGHADAVRPFDAAPNVQRFAVARNGRAQVAALVVEVAEFEQRVGQCGLVATGLSQFGDDAQVHLFRLLVFCLCRQRSGQIVAQVHARGRVRGVGRRAPEDLLRACGLALFQVRGRE
jgi:hypothetical protein